MALIGAGGLAAIGIVAGPTLLAQSTASSTKASVQRTADGHPDLSGMYDVATMTPLQRPVEFGNRRALTKEEAAEMEQYEKQRQEKSAAPSSPNREAPPVGGDALNSRLDSASSPMSLKRRRRDRLGCTAGLGFMERRSGLIRKSISSRP
jgi:hypothetical protein